MGSGFPFPDKVEDKFHGNDKQKRMKIFEILEQFEIIFKNVMPHLLNVTDFLISPRYAIF